MISEEGLEVRVEGITDTGRFEKVYNLRVAENHTYYVGSAAWGFDVWVHNARCSWHSKILRIQLVKSEYLEEKYAAHLVPTGISSRNPIIQSAIQGSRDILNKAKIGLNHSANGFFTNFPNHLGTHTHEFLLDLYSQLEPLAGNRSAIISKLKEISSALKGEGIKF